MGEVALDPAFYFFKPTLSATFIYVKKVSKKQHLLFQKINISVRHVRYLELYGNLEKLFTFKTIFLLQLQLLKFTKISQINEESKIVINFKKQIFLNFCKIHSKTPLLESHCNKVTETPDVKFLRTFFYKTTVNRCYYFLLFRKQLFTGPRKNSYSEKLQSDDYGGFLIK